jgi:hypothetical protein
MAKISGLAWTTLSLDDAGGTARDIRNDITNFNFATPRAVQDVTGVDKSAFERLLLLADFSGQLNGVFNPTATTSSHAVLKTVSSSTVLRTLSLAIASQTLAGEVIVSDYQISRGQDGSLTWTAPFSLADGAVPTWS